MDAILQVDELTRRFGPVVAVDHLSLTLRPGEIVGLVGPDGAGKTTTFRLLVGALRPDSGRGRIAGAGKVEVTAEDAAAIAPPAMAEADA